VDVEPVGTKSSEAEGGVVSIEVALALSVEGSPAKREFRGAVRCMAWLPPGMRTILRWGFGNADLVGRQTRRGRGDMAACIT